MGAALKSYTVDKGLAGGAPGARSTVALGAGFIPRFAGFVTFPAESIESGLRTKRVEPTSMLNARPPWPET